MSDTTAYYWETGRHSGEGTHIIICSIDVSEQILTRLILVHHQTNLPVTEWGSGSCLLGLPPTLWGLPHTSSVLLECSPICNYENSRLLTMEKEEAVFSLACREQRNYTCFLTSNMKGGAIIKLKKNQYSERIIIILKRTWVNINRYRLSALSSARAPDNHLALSMSSMGRSAGTFLRYGTLPASMNDVTMPLGPLPGGQAEYKDYVARGPPWQGKLTNNMFVARTSMVKYASVKYACERAWISSVTKPGLICMWFGMYRDSIGTNVDSDRTDGERRGNSVMSFLRK